VPWNSSHHKKDNKNGLDDGIISRKNSRNSPNCSAQNHFAIPVNSKTKEQISERGKAP
jgi:hypothetical protein